MNNEQLLQQVAIDIAVIKSKLGTIEEHVKSSDSMFKDIYEKLTKYDIVFGKAGMVVTALLFIITIVVTNLGAYLRELFTRN